VDADWSVVKRRTQSGETSRRVAGRGATLAALAAITLFGAALRVFRIGFDDYWIDEVASIQIAQSYSIVGLFLQLPFVDRHPGLFYSLLKGWMLVLGDAEAVTRLLPALVGVATLPAMYLLGKRLFGVEAGLVATALLAVSRYHVFYAQTLRMYTLLVLLTLVSTYFLLDLRIEHSRRTVVAYALSAIALGNTHFLGVLVLVGHVFYIFATEYVVGARTATGQWDFLTYQLVVGVGIVPGVGGIAAQVLSLAGGQSQSLGWIDAPTADWPLRALGTYFRQDAPLLGLALLLFVVVVAVGTLLWRRADVTLADLRAQLVGDERTYLLAGLVAFPILVPFIVSLTFKPLTVIRYTIAASVGVYLAVGALVRVVPLSSVRYGLVVVLLVGAVAGLPSYYTGEGRIEWSNAAATIHEDGDSNPYVVTTHEFHYTFRYYLAKQGGGELYTHQTWEPSVVERADGSPIWVVWEPGNRTAFSRGLESETNYTATSSEEYVGVGVTRYEPVNATG
jgi:mannosyltransferase